MTPLRPKDAAFLSVAIPAALVAAYAYFWRCDASRRMDSLEIEIASLTPPADEARAVAAASAALETARGELEAEKRAKPPPALLAGDPGDSFAEREGAVLRIFRDAGVAVLRAGDAENETGGEAASALESCGARPSPVCRRYRLDGGYPAVRRALDLLSSRRIAAIPSRVEMHGGGARWEVSIWE